MGVKIGFLSAFAVVMPKTDAKTFALCFPEAWLGLGLLPFNLFIGIMACSPLGSFITSNS